MPAVYLKQSCAGYIDLNKMSVVFAWGESWTNGEGITHHHPEKDVRELM